MAGWTGTQPREAGGRFGHGKTAQPQQQVISGITITPQMYKQALKQAAQIIREQDAMKAKLQKMSPEQRRLYGQTQSALRSNAAKLAAKRKKDVAAKAREPGARAAGAAMARRSPSSARPGPSGTSGRAGGAQQPSSAVRARLASYIRRP